MAEPTGGVWNPLPASDSDGRDPPLAATGPLNGGGGEGEDHLQEPRSAPMHALLGRVHLARRETDRAEAAFLRALELEPRLIEGYVELGRLYGSAGKYDQALAKLSAGLAVNPKNVVTLMLAGVIHQQRGDIAQAQAAYAKILALNPRFAPAANNLAWIYSEHGGEQAKDKALALAQMAKQVARGVYQRTLALLREGAVRLPDNAELQDHLGMAAARTGDRDLARKALAFAAGSPAAFKGKEEARRTLAKLRRRAVARLRAACGPPPRYARL